MSTEALPRWPAVLAAVAHADDESWVAETLNVEFGASFTGHRADEVDVVARVDRTLQLRAVACHASQAVPGNVLWRRLDLLADREHLRWLATPAASDTDALLESTGAPAPAARIENWSDS